MFHIVQALLDNLSSDEFSENEKAPTTSKKRKKFEWVKKKTREYIA